MPIATDISRVQYRGDGTQLEFPIPFYFLDSSHLRVVLYDADLDTEADLVLDTDYTIEGDLEQAGGTLTMIVAPEATEVLTILRDVPITQELEYRENELFQGNKTEQALDKLTMILQQLRDLITRGVVSKVTFAGSSVELAAGGYAEVFPAQITAIVDAVDRTFTFVEREPLAAGGWQDKAAGLSGTAVELVGGENGWEDNLPVEVNVYIHEGSDGNSHYIFETPKPCNCS